MAEPKKKAKKKSKKENPKDRKLTDNTHLGSSNAFEETENPFSRDSDDISDEKLDELIGK